MWLISILFFHFVDQYFIISSYHQQLKFSSYFFPFIMLCLILYCILLFWLYVIFFHMLLTTTPDTSILILLHFIIIPYVNKSSLCKPSVTIFNSPPQLIPIISSIFSQLLLFFCLVFLKLVDFTFFLCVFLMFNFLDTCDHYCVSFLLYYYVMYWLLIFLGSLSVWFLLYILPIGCKLLLLFKLFQISWPLIF